MGFYVNNSNNSVLNTVNTSGIYFYNLLDLFKYLSPKFKQTFNSLKKKFKVSEIDKAISGSLKSRPQCYWLTLSNENTIKKQKYNQWKFFTAQEQN